MGSSLRLTIGANWSKIKGR